jgi:hypothetical protein
VQTQAKHRRAIHVLRAATPIFQTVLNVMLASPKIARLLMFVQIQGKRQRVTHALNVAIHISQAVLNATIVWLKIVQKWRKSRAYM